MNFEEAKQYLRAQPSDGGACLYDHLTNVMLKFVTERKEGSEFEEVSAMVRAMTLQSQAEPKPSDEEEKESPPSEMSKNAQLEWVGTQQPLFVAPTEDVPEEATVVDLMSQGNLWEGAGVSVGRDSLYLLFLSLKALAVAKGVGLRFWGKLITRNGDYFVAESRTAENPAEGEARFQMEGSEGPNRYTYWVSKAPGVADSWRMLPHVTPEQIVVTRQVRRFLTGDLDAPVPCFPPLPGNKEENLARAMIALITADTVLALNGTLTVDDEAEEDMKAVKAVDEEEFAGLSFSVEDLKDANTWVHAELDINAVGRTQKTPLPLNDDGEPIEPEEEDPEPLAPLRAIAEDLEGEKVMWTIRTCPSGAAQSAHSSVFAKSLKWPGAVSVASGKTITNVYVGFGLPTPSPTNQTYSPRLPGPVQAEWAPPEDEEDKRLVEQEDVTIEPAKPEEEEE